MEPKKRRGRPPKNKVVDLKSKTKAEPKKKADKPKTPWRPSIKGHKAFARQELKKIAGTVEHSPVTGQVLNLQDHDTFVVAVAEVNFKIKTQNGVLDFRHEVKLPINFKDDFVIGKEVTREMIEKAMK